MALLTLEAVGPRGEELALEAGDAVGVPVGWDEEFQCATYDADAMDLDELTEAVHEALAELDPDWGTHLQPIED